MVEDTYERHGVYHIATRGGHEASVVIIDDGHGTYEGFRCDVRDIRQNDDPSPNAPVENHNAHVVVGDETVTFDADAVDFSVYFGRLGSDRFERVEFPDTEEAHSNRYANLADAHDYEPDVGERSGEPLTDAEAVEELGGGASTDVQDLGTDE